MTFTEIQTEVMARLGLTSSDDGTRIARAINRVHREVCSSVGIKHATKRETTAALSVTQGVSEITIEAEKVIEVFNRAVTPYLRLEEVSQSELRNEQPYSTSDLPTKWALVSQDTDEVTIEINVIPQTAIATLYADVYGMTSTMSGSNEPLIPQSFHDILMHGVLIDEYDKLEKPAMSAKSEKRYEKRLSELRYFVNTSTTKQQYQGKTNETQQPVSGSGGSGSVNGATSWTQTGLITFDRDPSAPFAVTSGSAKVSNLDADLLDGYDWLTMGTDLLWSSDNTKDIGASGATRPRDLFLGRNAVIGGTTTFGGNIVSNLLFTDATYDIGAAGATRPRDLHLSRDFKMAGSMEMSAASGQLVFTGATAPEILWNGFDGTTAGLISSNGSVTVNIDKDNDGTNATFKVKANNSTDALSITEAGDATLAGILIGRHVTAITNSETGALNNWAPTGLVTGTTFIHFSGAAPAVTGIAGGSIGSVIVLRNGGTGVMTLAHQSASSSVGNKLLNAVTSGLTPIAAGGYAIYIHDGTNWNLAAHDQGSWITPSYVDSDFLGDTTDSNWVVDSGDVATMKYRLHGKALTVSVQIATSTVANTPTHLVILNGQWGGFTITSTMTGAGSANENGTGAGMFIYGVATETKIRLAKNSLAVWANNTNTTAVYGQVTFEVT